MNHAQPVHTDKPQAAASAVMVRIEHFEGSSPREVGACMLVTADGLEGSVGGGHLEYEAMAHARSLLAVQQQAAPHSELRRYALGPALGQCCGGVVWLRFVVYARTDEKGWQALRCQVMQPAQQPLVRVALFGGGHVGKAIVRALQPLPCRVHWIDSRDEIFPGRLPAHVHAEHSAPVQAAVPDLATHSLVLIMSFSHAEDLDIVAACLQRQRERADLPFIGLIGSKTKWASFRKRLLERGFSEAELVQVTCPIGLPSISGKEPAVIAASVVAQLLQFRVHQS